MVVLTAGDIKDFLVIHQFAQRDVIQKTGQSLAQIAPQRVSQTLIAALAAAFTLTTGGVNGLVHCADNFANRAAPRFLT